MFQIFIYICGNKSIDYVSMSKKKQKFHFIQVDIQSDTDLATNVEQAIILNDYARFHWHLAFFRPYKKMIHIVGLIPSLIKHLATVINNCPAHKERPIRILGYLFCSPSLCLPDF